MKGKEHAEKNQNLIYQNRHQKIRIEQLKKNYSRKRRRDTNVEQHHRSMALAENRLTSLIVVFP